MEEGRKRGEAGAGALDVLVEVELRVEAQLDRARSDAEARVEAARAEAGRIAAGFEETLAREEARLHARLEREYEQALDATREQTEAAAARYRGAGEDVVAALGRWVAARIIGSEGPA